LKQIHNGLNVQKSFSNPNCKLQTWDIQWQKVKLKSEYELGNYLVFLVLMMQHICYHVDIRCGWWWWSNHPIKHFMGDW
jgi:hypothetical protein